ncbi:MAG: DASS family sodium-coupled anion symporter, partial [Thermoanaerobaculia bacterium]
KPTAIVVGLLVAAAVLFIDTPLLHQPETGARPAHAAAIASLMAIWWLTEAIPIYWTACLPILLFPLSGVFGGGMASDFRSAVSPYFDPYIFLFAGGMAIAAAMQQWNLHRRIALGIMQKIGTDPRRLLAGVLTATAFISLWISNTATATMMMPIGIALIVQLEARNGSRLRHYGMAIMLAIAYGANIGGIGTKIGTAPNGQFAGFLERMGKSISFMQFLAVGLPFVVLMLPIVWAVLWRLGKKDELAGDAQDVVRAELAALGKVQRPERIVALTFLAAAALWIVSKPIVDALSPQFVSFAPWKLGTAHVEGAIAMAAALVLLLWPHRGRRVLEMNALGKVPWETLLLLGGGFAMAAGIQQSGLSGWMGAQLSGIASMPPLAQILLASVATVALSAVASNTATIAVMLPVLKDATGPGVMTSVLFAATIAASCDFALPAGTPPNAIVFGSGYVRIPTMAKIGIQLDLLAALVAAFWCWAIVPLVLGN